MVANLHLTISTLSDSTATLNCVHCGHDVMGIVWGPDADGVVIYHTDESLKNALASMKCPQCGRGD